MIKIQVVWFETSPRMASRFRRKNPTIKQFECNLENDWMSLPLAQKRLTTFFNFDGSDETLALGEKILFLTQIFEDFERKIDPELMEEVSSHWITNHDPFCFNIEIGVNGDFSNAKVRKISKEIFLTLKSDFERHLKLRAFE